MGAWGKLWTWATRQEDRPIAVGDAELPLVLVLGPGGSGPASVDEVRAIRKWEIPECCLGQLRGRVRWGGSPIRYAVWGLTGLGLLAVAIESSSRAVGTLSEMARGALVSSIVVWDIFRCIGAWSLGRWRVWRDREERRITTEDGALTRKWTQRVVVPGSTEEERARARAYPEFELKIEMDGDSYRTEEVCTVLKRWVRVGRRELEVSRELFDRLGSGVRYRMYLSKHAREVIAIEPAERRAFACYRVIKAHARENQEP